MKNRNFKKNQTFRRNFDFFIENSNTLMIFENSKMFQIFFRAAPKNDFRQDKLIFLIQICFQTFSQRGLRKAWTFQAQPITERYRDFFWSSRNQFHFRSNPGIWGRALLRPIIWFWIWSSCPGSLWIRKKVKQYWSFSKNIFSGLELSYFSFFSSEIFGIF